MIAAIVVFFHPDQCATERLLSSLLGQVDTVYAIDNTPGSTSAKKPPLEGFGKAVTYVPLGRNLGIAAAQNFGIQLGIRDGHTHILLLDQDSSLLPDTVRKFLLVERQLLDEGGKVAVIGPQIVDRKTGKRPTAIHYRFGFVRKILLDNPTTLSVPTDNLAASGSFFPIESLKSIGLMREDLFIDHVDTEWAFRARSMGYQSYCAANAIMEHDFGERAVNLLGKAVFIHNMLRYRYQLRNESYLLRLKTMGWHWRIYAAFKIPYHLLLYTALSENRGNALLLLLKAITDGLRGRLGEIVT